MSNHNYRVAQLEATKRIFVDFCYVCRKSCGNNHKLAADIIKKSGWRLSRQLQKDCGINPHKAYDYFMV